MGHGHATCHAACHAHVAAHDPGIHSQVLTRCVFKTNGSGLLLLPMHHGVVKQGKMGEMLKDW